MRSILRHSLSLLAFAVIATAWPIAAQLPLECQVIEPSADPPPADLIDYCRQFVQLPKGFAPVSPTDMADGVNNLNGTVDNCSSLTLNAPELVTTVGMLPSNRPACDFADNDFTKLYCFDTAIPSNLSRINPSTCVETAIGIGSNTGTFINGLAWDATSRTMFAASSAELFTVNLATGATTLIGTITNSNIVFAIGVDPHGDLFGHDGNSNLLAIDKSTAAGTVRGPLGFVANFSQGMDFDHSDDTCYLFAFNTTTFRGELRTCNTTTGATTLIGPIGSTTPGGQNDWTAAGIRTPDGMVVFSDGFESGDTTSWSSTTN